MEALKFSHTIRATTAMSHKVTEILGAVLLCWESNQHGPTNATNRGDG
jgi:hypothetical protein